MLPLLSARTFPVAEVVTVRGFARAAFYGRPPSERRTLVDPLRKGCPTCPRLRRQIDGCLKSPARVSPIPATGPQTVGVYQGQGGLAPGASLSIINSPSLSLAATCCSPSERFIT